MVALTVPSSKNEPLLPSNGMETSERRWKVPSVFWLPLIICGVLLFVVDVFQSQYTMIPTRLANGELFIDQDSLKGFLIKTPGCRIPYMDPYDHTIKKYIHKEKRPVTITDQMFKSYVLHEWCVLNRLFNAYYEVKFKKAPDIVG
ncbi:hypothetical protein MTP99_010908 [Tenebrio molitor]|nr:hypothetical protein MTP99_010908 [Tenebrio molitor]